MHGPTSRTAPALVGRPSAHQSGAAALLTAGARAEVGHRVAALARPGLASSRDLLAWLHGLDPHGFARVARLLLREPARHFPALGNGTAAPTPFDETVADAIRRYGLTIGDLA